MSSLAALSDEELIAHMAACLREELERKPGTVERGAARRRYADARREMERRTRAAARCGEEPADER